MEHKPDIIEEIDAFCAKHDLSPATVCSDAVGNARLYERMKKRAAKHVADAEAIRAHMAAREAKATTQGAS